MKLFRPVGESVSHYLMFCLVLHTICGIEPARVLLLSVDQHSHMNFMAAAGQKLTEAGHSVTFLAANRHSKLLQKKGLESILYSIRTNSSFIDEMETFIFKGASTPQIYQKAATTFVQQCTEVLQNDNIMKKIARSKFDLAIVNGITMGRCNYAIPYKFSIPYITITCKIDSWQSRVPAMPSVEPSNGIVRFTDEMTFVQRFQNLGIYIFSNLFFPPKVISDDIINKYCPERPTTSFKELYEQSELWLVTQDIHCLDYPRVSAPHYQFIGGIHTEPAKSLHNELESFVLGSEGLVVVSFGSLVKHLPSEITEKMLTAFGQRKERFIMRFDGDVNIPAPDNVKLLKWVPQNDLLGHRKTVLFITHAGHHGQLEALYHGVPMLAFPLVGDQFYNARRAQVKSFGEQMDIHSFTVQQLIKTIDKIINNSNYTNAVKQCSKMSKELHDPSERLIFWVNYILKYGGRYLRPSGFELSLMQFLMVDVLVCSITVVSLVLYCLIYLPGFCCRFCKAKDTGGKRKTE